MIVYCCVICIFMFYLCKYIQNKSYFSWSDRWGLEKIQKYWLEDIETEKVDIFVIDKNFINLPNFINE